MKPYSRPGQAGPSAQMVAMMFGYADDRAWWQAGPMPVATTAFWSLPIRAIYSVITGVTRRPGRWARERALLRRRAAHPGRRLAHGEIGTDAYRQLGDELSRGRPPPCRQRPTGDRRRRRHRQSVRKVIQMTASTAAAPVASWRQSPFTRRLVLYQDTIARGHEVQPLTRVRAEVHPAASGMRGTRFLTIIGPGFAWTQRSDVLHEGRCRKFAARINATAATAR